jgi:DNA-binding transcriptional regulator WhiA
MSPVISVVDNEKIKRELNRILIYECRCNERLKTKPEGSTRHKFVYTESVSGGLEHLKIETRLIDERFESVNPQIMIRFIHPAVPSV